MQVSTANDVKIYNLSHGKSVPTWESALKKQKLKKNDAFRRRIQLIQDFEMPDSSNCISISNDGRYAFAAGNYKPFIKCFDLNEMSLKFERGSDAEVLKIVPIADDYSKLVLMQENRWIELHDSRAVYFRLRIPRFGRDLSFCVERSELFVTSSGPDIYRFNLEQGEYLEPFTLNALGGTCMEIAPWHQLIAAGTTEGTVECWDHRDRTRVGTLDVMRAVTDYYDGIQEVTAIKFRDPLHFGVGTASGQVVLYDIRSSRPLLVKDLINELPIKKIDFVCRDEGNIVLSMDSRALKMWHEDTGRPISAIEPETQLSDFVRYPNSGLIFMANDAPKMLQYFVPILGTAPKFCSYLEAITEELEESDKPAVYDDYKFVTEKELMDIGLKHLIGTNMLRAYMHGYFMDVRLYKKAQTLTQPFAYDKYKDRKIKDAVESERDAAAVGVKKLKKKPKVNAELAARLVAMAKHELSSKAKKNTEERASNATAILEDDRFAKLFDNEEFRVNENSESFQAIKAQLENMQRRKMRSAESDEESEAEPQTEFFDHMEDDDDASESDSVMGTSESDSDDEDENSLAKQAKLVRKKESKKRQHERDRARREELEAQIEEKKANKPKKFTLHQLDTGENTKRFMDGGEEMAESTIVPLARRRVKLEARGAKASVEDAPFGGKSMTFELGKVGKDRYEENLKKKIASHQAERKKIRRSATTLNKTLEKTDKSSWQRGTRGRGGGARGGARGGSRGGRK